MKKSGSIILVILLVLSIFSVAFADSNIAPYASQVIDETTASISFPGGRASGLGTIWTVATADKVGISSIELYEENGSGWRMIASAYNKYGTGTDNYGWSVSGPAVKGKEYKLTVSFYGKIGNLTDTHSMTKYSTY